MDFPVNPTKLALINVDMQNCFVENSPIAAPEGRALVDRINPLIKTCRTAGVLIIHPSHVIRPARSNIGVMGEIIPSENTDMIRKGIVLRGNWHYNLTDFPALIKVISEVGNQLDKFITHQFGMSQVQEAWELQATGNAGKVVLDPWV